MNDTATCRILRCHGVSSGSSNSAASSETSWRLQSPKPRICAAENAASARVAGSFGSSSSASCPVGWFVRRPSSRATTSVPKREGGARPAVASGACERGGVGAETERGDELRVELRHRHRCGGVGRGGGLLVRQPGDEIGERRLRERCVRLEIRRAPAQQAARRDDANLALCPRLLRRTGGDSGEDEREAEERQEQAAAHLPGHRPPDAKPLGCTGGDRDHARADRGRAARDPGRARVRQRLGRRRARAAGARRGSTTYATARLRRRAGATRA